ncbi:DNA cytosine methyltransferase [Streptomyces sp. NPDC048243]|uniref:DNA cytosine methyltransferase n=1 Tax=Streptomyces sp. NPDC048243 TaxID=3365522 RepID=UPI0037234973
MDTYELVTLFAGAGAMDLAAHSLDVPAVGIEWNSSTCATRRAAGLATEEGDVRAYSPSDFPSANVLVGGPPCQTFATAGSGQGRRDLAEVQHLMQRMAMRDDVTADVAQLNDERTSLVLEPLRWALSALDRGHPYEALVLVQVPSVLPVWEEMGDVLSAEGYSVASGMLNAEEFGVPQTRRRAVLIAKLRGTPVFPKSTHQPYSKHASNAPSGPTLVPCVTMGETLDRPESFYVISNYGSAGAPGARQRRTSAEPAFPVTGKFPRNRVQTEAGAELDRLTCAEAGLLQSFPANYPWAGLDRAQQIGNATPVALATRILAAVLGRDQLAHMPPSHESAAAPSSTAVSARMARQSPRDTVSEISARRLLHTAGLRFRTEVPVPGMPRRRIDIAFSKAKIAVFMDGCFWHGCPEHATQPKANVEWWRTKVEENKARDAELTEHLTDEGWTVLRFWEHESQAHIARQIADCHARRSSTKE